MSVLFADSSLRRGPPFERSSLGFSLVISPMPFLRASTECCSNMLLWLPITSNGAAHWGARLQKPILRWQEIQCAVLS
jgi:hypothetical protein